MHALSGRLSNDAHLFQSLESVDIVVYSKDNFSSVIKDLEMGR